MKELLLILLVLISTHSYCQNIEFPISINEYTSDNLEPLGSNNDGFYFYNWKKGMIIKSGSDNNVSVSDENFFSKIKYPQLPENEVQFTTIDNYIIFMYTELSKKSNSLIFVFFNTKTMKPDAEKSKIYRLNDDYLFYKWSSKQFSLSFSNGITPANQYAILEINDNNYHPYVHIYYLSDKGVEEIPIKNNDLSKMISEDAKNAYNFSVNSDNEIIFLTSEKNPNMPFGKDTAKHENYLCKINNKGETNIKKIGETQSNTFLDLDLGNNNTQLTQLLIKEASRKEPINGKNRGTFYYKIIVNSYDNNFNLLNSYEYNFEELNSDIKDDFSLQSISYFKNKLCIIFKRNFDETYISTGNSGYTKYWHEGYNVLIIDDKGKLIKEYELDAGANGKETFEYIRFGSAFIENWGENVYLIANKNLRFFKDEYGNGEDNSELVSYKINMNNNTLEEKTLLSYKKEGLITRFATTHTTAKTARSFFNNVQNKIPFVHKERDKKLSPPNLENKKGPFFYSIITLE